MSNQSNLNHSLVAYTYPMDLVPHVYVDGEVPVVFETISIALKEKSSQETSRQDLQLEFDPDVYDSNSATIIQVDPFQKQMPGTPYETVTISTSQGDIELKVEERQRS
jgi:hypothetical protein